MLIFDSNQILKKIIESAKNIPDLHPKFFWDFRIDKIVWQGGYKMAIGRIIECGDRIRLMRSCVFTAMKK
ncbi:DUF6922 domain-containing protein [Flavobacterium gelatinilyticum]|uniref:DUF6922 domain-containing protein n=1 Tax=Flavobacterium gelatinilyticum TaxID=3003260 RepID=UPI003D796B82